MSKTKSLINQYGDAILLLNGGMDAPVHRLFRYYSNLTMNRYRWINLPNKLESRHIESALFSRGQAFFYNDPEKGFVCLPCSPRGLNFYGDPTNIVVTGVNFSKELDIDDGIRILENDTCTPPIQFLYYYIELCEEVDNALRTNLRQQKFPFIVPVSQNTELSMKTALDKITSGEMNIMVDKEMSEQLSGKEGIKVLQTGVPYLLDKFQDFKKKEEDYLNTYLGINNANTHKKERLITNEVDANNDLINMSLDIGFKTRVYAKDLINEKFGLDIDVVKVKDIINDKDDMEGDELG